jgi:hypothetical protein
MPLAMLLMLVVMMMTIPIRHSLVGGFPFIGNSNPN